MGSQVIPCGYTKVVRLLVCSLLLVSSVAFADPVELLAQPVPLTSHPSEDYMPALSGNGNLLAFVSTRGGVPNIWLTSLVSSSLTNARQITFQPAGAKDPFISADGQNITFAHRQDDGSWVLK